MKLVSFEAAKALKEAGYNELCSAYITRYYYIKNNQRIPEDVIRYKTITNAGLDIEAHAHKTYSAPTYIDVWLWLCNKGIVFYPTMYSAHEQSGWTCYYRDHTRVIGFDTFGVYNNPEESIIQAIEYLVNNKVI